MRAKLIFAIMLIFLIAVILSTMPIIAAGNLDIDADFNFYTTIVPLKSGIKQEGQSVLRLVSREKHDRRMHWLYHKKPLIVYPERARTGPIRNVRPGAPLRLHSSPPGEGLPGKVRK